MAGPKGALVGTGQGGGHKHKGLRGLSWKSSCSCGARTKSLGLLLNWLGEEGGGGGTGGQEH